MWDAVVIGECMVELSLEGERRAAIGYAGDTFNTAVYLARLGIRTAYGTALGADDPFSRGAAALMSAEDVGQDLVVRVEGRVPGLYAIQCDAHGERSFYYWRDSAPARDFMRLADLKRLGQALNSAKLVYVSAITLAILGEAGRAALAPLLAEAAKDGAGVALDTNYRARLWPGQAAAREAVEAFAPYCRWISASSSDLEAFGAEADDCAARWSRGGAEVVLRRENREIEVCTSDGRETFAPDPPVKVVDTTGAGDSFNAGYLSARLRGAAPAEAIALGRRVAGVVVQHPGAIIDRRFMPA